jgi:UDP-N-acetylmuramyl tripeptide synthase
MARPSVPQLAIARAVGTLSRIAGGGATSAPGKVLLRLDSDAIGELAARLGHGNVVVSATNGKTTTAAMLADIFKLHGERVVTNAAGANMAGGIASALLYAATPRGAISGDVGLFEVDEFWLADVVTALRPRTIVLCNLFRDQLDRYGELDTIAARWAEAVGEAPGSDAQLVLDADDPVVADLGRGQSGALYFGVQDDSLAQGSLGHATDAKHCRRCGAPYVFDAVYLGHLGRYHCASCGQRRPDPTVFATDVRLHGVRSATFTLHTPAGQATVALPLPGLYNVYNALAAAAAATAMEIPLATVAAGLANSSPAFGRAETATFAGRQLRILLVKNPAGANEVLRTLALEDGEHDLLGVLNDNIADGRDVSWIWDADFEPLASRVRQFTCSGTRAAELAVRLKYAGVPSDRIAVVADLPAALASAAANRRSGNDQSPLYALPTYTAMLALRKLLGKGGRQLRNAA